MDRDRGIYIYRTVTRTPFVAMRITYGRVLMLLLLLLLLPAVSPSRFRFYSRFLLSRYSSDADGPIFQARDGHALSYMFIGGITRMLCRIVLIFIR